MQLAELRPKTNHCYPPLIPKKDVKVDLEISEDLGDLWKNVFFCEGHTGTRPRTLRRKTESTFPGTLKKFAFRNIKILFFELTKSEICTSVF